MKKIAVVVSTVFLGAAVSFAQTSNTAAQAQVQLPAQASKESAQHQQKKMEKKQHVENIMGEIVKINTEKNEKGEITKAELVLKTHKEEKTIQIDPNQLSSLKEGMKIKIKMIDGKVSDIKEVKKGEKKGEMKKEMKKENEEMKSTPQSNIKQNQSSNTPKTN